MSGLIKSLLGLTTIKPEEVAPPVEIGSMEYNVEMLARSIISKWGYCLDNAPTQYNDWHKYLLEIMQHTCYSYQFARLPRSEKDKIVFIDSAKVQDDRLNIPITITNTTGIVQIQKSDTDDSIIRRIHYVSDNDTMVSGILDSKSTYLELSISIVDACNSDLSSIPDSTIDQLVKELENHLLK